MENVREEKACELSDLCRPGLDNAHLYQCAAVISDSETVWDNSKGSTDYRNSSRKCAVLYGNPVVACSGGFAGRSRDNSGRKNVFLPDCSTLVGTAMLSGQKAGKECGVSGSAICVVPACSAASATAFLKSGSCLKPIKTVLGPAGRFP